MVLGNGQGTVDLFSAIIDVNWPISPEIHAKWREWVRAPNRGQQRVKGQRWRKVSSERRRGGWTGAKSDQ